MRITEIRDLTIPLSAGISNALVDFGDHSTSLVAVVTDRLRGGTPVAGVAFGSIGRFGQSGILRERIAPRLLAAPPDSLLDPATGHVSPERVAAVAMRNEKFGGHGDRAVAVAAVELAVWDLNAKLVDEPAHVTIARDAGRVGDGHGLPVYAAGGYYRPREGIAELKEEFRRFMDAGFAAFKMKIGGGVPLRDDLDRIEAVLDVVGDGQCLRVDANGRFGREEAISYATALEPYGLAWFEEAGDPLDFELNRLVTEHYRHPIATGENLFSVPDVTNLVRYGGMRPGSDVFQMDAGLSYGLTEYGRMLEVIEAAGFTRRSAAHPHGGHLINLHIAAGLGLGGCEAYPTVFAPVGGYSDGCQFEAGRIRPGEAPGFGLERKADLAPFISRILT